MDGLPQNGVPDGDMPDVTVPCSPDGLAFVQFSSGSTGQPEGVELTHAAVTANLRQIVTVSDLGTADVVVGWMPYFHDMGLIGTHLAPLAARAKQVKIGPLAFARRPGVWFETATTHRATHLSAADFALALAARAWLLKRSAGDGLAPPASRSARPVSGGAPGRRARPITRPRAVPSAGAGDGAVPLGGRAPRLPGSGRPVHTTAGVRAVRVARKVRCR
jgi:acyl-CoA synthetase (AMP-forming)/AMP-acid ligase II